MKRPEQRVLLFVLLLLAACSDRAPQSAANLSAGPMASSPARGGEAVVLLDSAFAGSWPAGLDPATNPNGGSNTSLMNAIFGGLFQLVADDDGSNARIEGDLVSGYEVVDEGRSIVLKLRPGLTFSDGTPLDAEAVRFNIERAIKSDCSCAPLGWPWVQDKPVSARDVNTVILHLTKPYGPIIAAILTSNINWIVSPTAIKTMGADAFRMKPVGAGPFRIVSSTLSSELVLERNPRYWRQGRPYLDRLTFRTIAGDQAAFQALRANDAQAYEGMASPSLIREAEKVKELTVTRQPATSPGVIQLNTRVPPFDDQRAREAIYYATDVESLRQGLFYGWFPTSQSFTTSAGMFHRETVDGYRTYNLQKAKSIVRELGGLEVRLGTLKSLVAEQIVTALQSQWQEAGIKVQIETYDLGGLIGKFSSKKWQALLQYVGSYDPDVGSGLSFRFHSDSLFSGTTDPKLDALLLEGLATTDYKARDSAYSKTAQYLSDHAYAPFLVAQSSAQVTRKLHGPGLTTKIPPLLVSTSILWQDAWIAPN